MSISGLDDGWRNDAKVTPSYICSGDIITSFSFVMLKSWASKEKEDLFFCMCVFRPPPQVCVSCGWTPKEAVIKTEFLAKTSDQSQHPQQSGLEQKAMTMSAL